MSDCRSDVNTVPCLNSAFIYVVFQCCICYVLVKTSYLLTYLVFNYKVYIKHATAPMAIFKGLYQPVWS